MDDKRQKHRRKRQGKYGEENYDANVAPSGSTTEQQVSNSAGAYAVRGDQQVRRENAGNVSVASTDISSQQPFIVQAELASDREERLQQQVDALQARVDEIQPPSILVHAQPTQDLEARLEDLENRNAELEQLRNNKGSLQQDRHDMATPVGEKEDAIVKKKKRLIFVGVALLLIIIAVAVAVPISSQSSGNSDDDSVNSNTDSSRSPTVAPTTNNIPLEPWIQFGQNLRGEASNDRFGRSVSLSRDGTVLAVGTDPVSRSNNPGYVSVFQLSGNNWNRLGQDLVGERNGDNFGFSVSLNSNGTMLAVGAYRNDAGGDNAGHVRVFEYRDPTWTQLGNDIDGLAPANWFGWSVSLSDADIVAVGGYLSGGDESGSVRLFQYSRDNETWTQLGQTLVGQAAGDQFGYSVSLDSSGTMVAVGAPESDAGVDRGGQASVFQYNSTTWVPMGTPINGKVSNGGVGNSVSLSRSFLAVGAPESERVRVFEYNNSTTEWTQRGQTLLSEGDGLFGWSVSLSQDANRVAVGIPLADEGGQMRIFQYDDMVWNQMGTSLSGEAALDEFGRSVSLSGNGTVVGIGAHLGDFNGVLDVGYAKVFTLN